MSSKSSNSVVARIAETMHHDPAMGSRPGGGCYGARVGMLLTTMIVAAACATRDPRTEEQRAADRAVETQVHAALRADADLYAAHIDVQARQGVVRLTGWVVSADESKLAERDSQSVPGVQRVVDQLELMDWEPHY